MCNLSKQNSVDLCTHTIENAIVAKIAHCYACTTMSNPYTANQNPAFEQATTRIIQEYVPGRQVTIAHIIANPDKPLCARVGLSEAEAIGIMTITPGESAIIAGDLALKAADVEIGFLDRFSGTLVINGRLSSVQSALEAANRGMADILGFHPAPITRT